MRVDTARLRAAAATLRDEVAENLRRAGIQAGGPERDFRVAGAFDSYTTPGPYRAAVAAWEKEVEVLAETARQLADALEATAAEHDTPGTRGTAGPVGEHSTGRPNDARSTGRLAGARSTGRLAGTR